MTDKKLLYLYNWIKVCSLEYIDCVTYPSRAPNIKTMANYINHVFGKFGYVAFSEKTATSGKYLHTSYTGTEITVKYKNKPDSVFRFSNNFGEHSNEVCKFIMSLHEEHQPGFERDIKLSSLLDN